MDLLDKAPILHNRVAVQVVRYLDRHHRLNRSIQKDDRFLPLSAQAITPSILPQHQREDRTDAKFGTFTAINMILGKTIGVGVYSVSSSIYSDLGSVGMTITMWLIGSLISFCGLSVYLDLGSAIPRSGGERVYLERIFRKPRMLATCMFMSYVVLLGFSTPNCIVMGQYTMFALGFTPTTFNVRTIAVVVITCSCILHARYPRLGLQTVNVLGIAKMLTLAFIVAAGLAASVTQFTYLRSTAPTDSPLYMNFHPHSLFAGTSRSPYAHATALLKILYCFRGYNTANTVLGSLKRPIPTLKRSAPIALSLVSASYLLTNLAYFAVIPAASLRNLDTLIAAHFLRQIFGSNVLGERILPWLVISSAFGNVAATSFAQATVNQELARDGLLPYSNFFAAESPWNRSPAAGLLLHWAVSVLVIVLPPPGPIYEFLVELGGYPVSMISVAVAGGLLYLQLSRREKWRSPIPASKIATGIFLASNLLLLVFPWVEPKTSQDDSEAEIPTKKRFVYYAYPACGVGVLALGAYYWVWWRYMRVRAGMGMTGGARVRMTSNGRRNGLGMDMTMQGFGGEQWDALLVAQGKKKMVNANANARVVEGEMERERRNETETGTDREGFLEVPTQSTR
ncbi:MAG: hypothetical protein Q9160_000335 [Pyrenula sp. 1 TL-2023]